MAKIINGDKYYYDISNSLRKDINLEFIVCYHCGLRHKFK